LFAGAQGGFNAGGSNASGGGNGFMNAGGAPPSSGGSLFGGGQAPGGSLFGGQPQQQQPGFSMGTSSGPKLNTSGLFGSPKKPAMN